MKKVIMLGATLLFMAASCNQISKNNQNQSNQPQLNQQASTTQGQNLPQGEKNGWDAYASPAKYGFSIRYPKDYGFNTDYSKIEALGYIPVCDESTVACVFYTGDKYKGTNFESGGVSVNILKDLNTEAKCYGFKVPTNEAQTVIGMFDINGVDFKSASGGQGAAGHFMKTQVYRNFHNSACYELAQRVGSSNIGNYPAGTVSEFNENEIWNNLKQILSTFEFTDKAPAEPSGQITVTGTIVCLPHKNVQPGQPQTLECAIGLKESQTGKYYGLKDNPTPIYDTSAQVWVTGVLKDDLQGKYDVVGNIEVSEITRLDR